MNSEEKNGKLKEELQSINDHLKKYTAPASNSGSDVITEAMRKGKVNSDSRFYKDDDVLSNSSHSLNNSYHSRGIEPVFITWMTVRMVKRTESCLVDMLIKIR